MNGQTTKYVFGPAHHALAVRHHHQPDALLRPVLEDAVYVPAVGAADVDAPRSVEDFGESLTHLAHGGRVHDGHEFLRVVVAHAESIFERKAKF